MYEKSFPTQKTKPIIAELSSVDHLKKSCHMVECGQYGVVHTDIYIYSQMSYGDTLCYGWWSKMSIVRNEDGYC